ncbi:kinase-like domain-containing protein [Cokeromyces recurvatus]|uniref:kinase-like domain-containing protein n=1 Tax=Cokeromyces recurvatus TaxID=90255 RepID=UPI00221F7783|nr:kinase-like domain-containing protein [Cokeromyces recurvatus]KAI7906140.1 kinase-like domain-containing protein [Cokeromyces recurvatus]
MATTVKINVNNSKQEENVENNTHRRQKSRSGLEINTDLNKTNAFFYTPDSSTNTPRPPPSLSRKISIRQTATSPWIPEDDQQQQENYRDSYANRLRHLVASSSRLSTPTHLNPNNEKDSHLSTERFLVSSLPTPTPESSQQTTSTSTTTTTTHNAFLFPSQAEIQEIPIISSTLDPHLLSSHEEDTIHHSKLSFIPNHENEDENDDIVGHQIGADYRICKLLGVGAFSKVYLTHHLTRDQFFAIKTIKKGKLFDDSRVRSSILREINILKSIQHPNIVHLETTMETEKMVCIVLEYVEGGELFDFVKKLHKGNQSMNEIQVRTLFLQLLHAVKWLHERNIVHRDLKLENILIHKDDHGEMVLKITDFGLARVIDPKSPLLVTRCGSEEYAAPEIIKQENYDGRKTDIWSLGIILYTLLVGYLPFRYDPRKQERVSQLFYRIVRAEVKWPQDAIISDEAKQVVHAILERDPQKEFQYKILNSYLGSWKKS